MKRKQCPVFHGMTRQLTDDGYCMDCQKHWTDKEIEQYEKEQLGKLDNRICGHKRNN